MLKIDNIKVYEDLNFDELKSYICKKYKISEIDIESFSINKKSIDARDKANVHYNYSVIFECKNEDKYRKYKTNETTKNIENIVKNRKSETPPIIVGAGPSRSFLRIKVNRIWNKANNNRARKKSRRKTK